MTLVLVQTNLMNSKVAGHVCNIKIVVNKGQSEYIQFARKLDWCNVDPLFQICFKCRSNKIGTRLLQVKYYFSSSVTKGRNLLVYPTITFLIILLCQS